MGTTTIFLGGGDSVDKGEDDGGFLEDHQDLHSRVMLERKLV